MLSTGRRWVVLVLVLEHVVPVLCRPSAPLTSVLSGCTIELNGTRAVRIDCHAGDSNIATVRRQPRPRLSHRECLICVG